jgi:hypothetical protein
MLQQEKLHYFPNDKAQNSPIPPLSVDAFLYSLERSPTPARFERRRQCLLQSRPRLPRMRLAANTSTTSVTGSEAMISQGHHVAATMALKAQINEDSETAKEHSKYIKATSTKASAEIARLVLSYPALATNVVSEANGKSDERSCISSQPTKKPYFDKVQSMHLFGDQPSNKYAEQQDCTVNNEDTGSEKSLFVPEDAE